jgi:hypothetical protein
MRSDRRAAVDRASARPWLDSIVLLACACFALAAVLLALVAVAGADPFAFGFFAAALAGALGALIIAIAAVARLLGFRWGPAASRAVAASLVAVGVAFLLIPGLAVARRGLAKYRASSTVHDVEARARYCARREARAIPDEPPASALDPRPRYREAVVRCMTEGGRFRDFPDGPNLVCSVEACTLDLSYLDTYPALDNRVIDLRPFMEEALRTAGAGPYQRYGTTTDS